VLYSPLTEILTVAAVWGDRILLKDSERLTFAVVALDGNEARFAKLAVELRNGGISTDGLDTFKLGYELVGDENGMRRD
jgi:hypothetical protein